MVTDSELLRTYAADGNEEAFATLVRRHVDLVYSTALRQTGGDRGLAEEVTMSVFADLARKAAGLADRITIAGWLYIGARHAAAKVVRSERRRREREQEAALMQQGEDNEAPTADWTKLEPVLDEAMGELPEADRDAVVLRFFARQSFSEIGEELSLSEDTARKRVERALDKLHGLLARRGVNSTGAALALAISRHAVGAAPSGIAAQAIASIAGGVAGVATAAAPVVFMAKLPFYTAIAAVGLFTGAIWWQSRQTDRAGDADAARLSDENATLRRAVEREARRAEDLETRLAAAGRQIAAQHEILERDRAFEDALGAWIGRVRKLNRFLEANPQWHVPGFAHLSEGDWLDATKDGALETEADYRKALAALRRAARSKGGIDGVIQSALKASVAAKDGNPPSDVQELVPFLPPSFDMSVLQRYALNPSGSVPRLVDLSGRAAAFILHELPVDELWDATYFYSVGGVVTTAGLHHRIERVLETFRQAHGSLPADAAALAPHLGNGQVDMSAVEEYLRSQSTRPEVPEK